MVRNFIFSLLAIAALITSPAYAGTGHSHSSGSDHSHSHGPVTPITEEQAIENATLVVSEIVTKGKLDASWTEVKAEKAEKKEFQKGQEWVVSFNNPNEPDTEKKTLYVFLSLDGHVIAANHSGK